ncbi:hypothetical protein [Schlesneria paludicola]|uniref:hypothetical protein n=1 Tax=Schlesneria paludicola TaxID=360056 RepID=UPI00029B36C3|nr:hypothetical protein [Schlesneria paludicola]
MKDEFAGREAECQKCGSELKVPDESIEEVLKPAEQTNKPIAAANTVGAPPQFERPGTTENSSVPQIGGIITPWLGTILPT